MNKFLKEIFEQPMALRNTLEFYINGKGKSDLEKVTTAWKSGGFKNVLFTGMGSSYFAPSSASCILSNHGIASHNMNAGELLHYHLPVLKEETLLMCISQSGESYEVVRLLEKLSSGITCLGITNDDKSSLAMKSSITLLSKAGKEEMTSTKTYISTLLVLHIFAKAITGGWNERVISEINKVIEDVSSLIENREEWLSPAIDHLGNPGFVQIIGRGPSYSSVLQGALMIMEAARKPASGMLGGEFRHGPLEMSKIGFRAIILAPLGNTYDQGIKLAGDITRFGGKVVLVTNGSEILSDKNIFTLRIACQDEYLFPVAAIIPLQFIVNRWAEDSGHEPGNFIMGAKVTTTE